MKEELNVLFTYEKDEEKTADKIIPRLIKIMKNSKKSDENENSQ